jgi:hypothetical protein
MPSKPSAKKLDRAVGPVSSKYKESVHYEFAVRGQLIRWFHERSTKELKAMRKGFEAAQAATANREVRS